MTTLGYLSSFYLWGEMVGFLNCMNIVIRQDILCLTANLFSKGDMDKT